MIRSLSTPAKINLYLEVTGRRSDGYHELLTVFYPLPGLCDTLQLEIVNPGNISMQCSHPSVPDDATNLCCRAAAAFAEAADIKPQWSFHLTKRIPVAAGLGGGSSNAAGALTLLNKHYDHPLTDLSLHEIAAKLGADVPFFLNPVPSLAQGIGDDLQPIPCKDTLDIVLLNPGFPISAAWAYQHYQPSRSRSAEATVLLEAIKKGDLTTLAANTTNDLEHAALHKFPLLGMMTDFLLEAGCLAAHVSGSGPTVYGICKPGQGAAITSAAQNHFGSGMWCWECGPLG